MVTALCRNAATGAIATNSHHCKVCNAPVTQRCLKQGHVDYCEICKHIFNVKSRGGCLEHPYCDGYNRAAVNKRRGLEPDFHSAWDLEQEEKALRVEEAAEAEKARLNQRGYDEDWSRPRPPQYREKASPKEKKNNKQGKKQPMTPHLKAFTKVK